MSEFGTIGQCILGASVAKVKYITAHVILLEKQK